MPASTLSVSEFFASGRIADLVLAVLALEAAALWLWHRRTGRGVPPAELLGFAVAGAALLLALRAALTGAAWPHVALWLVVAGVAQVYDLARRWR
jgi:hypothetical protein